MNSAEWFWFAIAYQCGFAYVAALCFYQFGMMFTGTFGGESIAAILFAGLFLYLLFRKQKANSDTETDVRKGARV